ncbi:hypothetical protein CCS41_06190 [Candidatus Fukatsuia symbiotica]|uniref:Uncharacterized protein n=1 Tax=Candidatus Fukatsuia symbiotica TaxID=1878942 RepID=A0A2U8I4T5_9GAMM|nr:hypothetical protein CCS41_06190 [Candidatus Fukatsuia symbiotica]
MDSKNHGSPRWLNELIAFGFFRRRAVRPCSDNPWVHTVLLKVFFHDNATDKKGQWPGGKGEKKKINAVFAGC